MDRSIWDGTNKLNINTDGTLPNRFATSVVGITTIVVGASARLVVAANVNRYSVWLVNKGTSSIFIGASTNLTAGATGFNFCDLRAGSNVELKSYSGAIYATNGSSGYYDYLGVADIG